MSNTENQRPVSSTITIVNYGKGWPSRIYVYGESGALLMDRWVGREHMTKVVELLYSGIASTRE